MGTKKKHLNVVVLSSQCDAPNVKIDGKENKSAAGMQHNPPRDIFNAKKI